MLYNCLNIFSIEAARATLSGYYIQAGPGGPATFIHYDTSWIKSCDSYGTSGFNVCNDVILFPYTSPYPIQLFSISASPAADDMVFCEIEIFAGKFHLSALPRYVIL